MIAFHQPLFFTKKKYYKFIKEAAVEKRDEIETLYTRLHNDIPERWHFIYERCVSKDLVYYIHSSELTQLKTNLPIYRVISNLRKTRLYWK